MAKKFRKEIGYIITTSDGAKNEVSQKIFEDNGGASGYAEDYPDATIRMRDANNRDYQVPLSKWDFATQNGLRPFRLEKSVGYDEDDISDWLVGGAEANEELGVRGEELKGENDLKEVKDLKAVEADEPEAAVKVEANEELGVRGEELKGEDAKMDVKAMWRGDIQNPETVWLADAYMEGKVRPETKKNIAGAVLSAFAEEQKKGDQRAREQMSKPINGGFVPAYSGLHQAITRSGEIAKATDIKPMIENVTKNIVNDTAKMRAAILPYMEAGYDVEKASEMAINDIADSAQSLIIDEYKRQNAPESTLSYIAGNAFRNSLVAQLAQGLARVAGGASGLNEQLKDEAYAQVGEKAGMMARVTSGVGSLLLDAPIFGGLGQLGGAAAKGVTNAVGRQVATKVMGASGMAGVNAASRYVGGNVGMRMAQGSIGTGITLGSYDALGEALRGMRTDSFDVKEVLKRGAHGLGTGAAIGWITPASRYMSKDMSKAGKVMMDAGAFVTEAELFNLSGLMEEGKVLDLSSHVEGFAESAATLGMMKGSHALPKLATKGGRESLLKGIKARYNSPDYENKARFTREELADLKAKGYDLKEVFKSEESEGGKGLKGENDLKELRDLKGVEEVTPEVIEKNTRKEWEALETYQKMQADDRVPLGVKAKMAYYVEGKMAVNMPKATRVDWNKSGDGYVVETYDAMGRLLSRKNFARKDVKEVRKLVRELELACEGNSFSMLEDVNDRIIDNNAEARAAYDMAEGSSVEAKSLLNRVREIQAKADKDITDEERRLLTAFEVKRARYSLHENSSETIKSQIENETGLKIEDILSKSASKRSLEEVAALAKYRRELMRQLGVEKGFKELGVRDEELGVKNGENAEKAVDDADETNMRPVDVEDAIKVYELDEKSSNYIRKNPSEYASVLEELEADRAMAHAYAKGEPGSEAPEYWDYWKERDGLSEIGVRSEELGVEKDGKVLKGENSENAVKEEASEELGVRSEELKGKNDLKEVNDLKAVEADEPEAAVKAEEGKRDVENLTEAKKEDRPEVDAEKPEKVEIKAEEVKRDVENLTEAKKEDKPEVAAEKPAKVENKADVLHIKDRVTEWSAKTGEVVRVVERVEDITNTEARAAIESGVKVKGWYDTKSGEVVIYAPNVNSVRDVDLTVIHEVVSHKGLRDTLGKETYDRLCDKTWEMMDEDARAKYENYPGVGNIKDEAKRRRAAADEYIAGIAEKEEANMTEAERSAWKEVVKVITDFIKKIFSDAKITEEDIRQIIRASYRRMMEKQLGAEKGGKGLKGENTENEVKAEASEELGVRSEELKGENDLKEVKDLKERSANFDKVLEAQGGLLRGMPKSWRFNMYQVVGDGSEPAISGVYMNEAAEEAVATNKHIVVTNMRKYDAKKAGKIVTKSGKEIDSVSFPDYKRITPKIEDTIATGATLADIKGQVYGLQERLSQLSRGEQKRAVVELRCANGKVLYAMADDLVLFAKALNDITGGNVELRYEDRKHLGARKILGYGEDGVALCVLIDTVQYDYTVSPKDKKFAIELNKGVKVEQGFKAEKGGKVLKGENGENRVARVEEAIREQEVKRVADKIEGLDRRLAEIRTELSEDKEGRNIQAQADAMVELYGGYANAPADVRERIDNQVAKLSERRRALLEEERAIELEIKNTKNALADGGGKARFSVRDRKWYGGNSGYEGYSMSKRAAEAREEGRYPKTDFKKEYGVTDKELKSLIDAGIVSDKEWHHTSKYGNKTTFYGFENKGAIDFYNANKARVKGAIKDGKLEDLVTEFEDAAQSYYESEQLAWREAQAEEAKNREAHREYADYIKKQLPATYTAKNGAVVELNGSRRSENWVASLDGVRLGKRHGKGSRDTAFAEARDFVYDSFPTFEEWKAAKEAEEGGVRFRELSDEEVKEAVDEYKEHFRGKDKPEIVIIKRLEDVYDFALGLGLTPERARKYLEEVAEKKDFEGLYDVDFDKILIFGWSNPNPYSTSFHEDIHRAVVKMGGVEEFNELVEVFKELDPNLLKRIKKVYDEEAINDEVLAYTIQVALNGNAINELRDYLEGEAQRQFDSILNYIGYEKGRNSEEDVARYEPGIGEYYYEQSRTRTRRAIERRRGRTSLDRPLREAGEISEGYIQADARRSARLEGEAGGSVGGIDEGGARFRVLEEDEARALNLDSGEKVTGYRNVVLNEDGTFGSPMASSLRTTDRKVKEKTGGFELKKWEVSEERPHLVDENGKITLVKPDGKSVEKVDYNPYIHNRKNKVNSQFKQAWERPNLVYIETEIPKSDLESGYHAEKAKLPVGEHKWNGGNLLLSRYDKPVRIVGWEEVADDWQAYFGNKGIHFDIIPPALLPILEERGMNIIAPHKGMGAECNAAYELWKESKGKKGGDRSEEFKGEKGGNDDDVRFRVEEEERNLVGLHNLTEANLAHAVKMGGIANPSMAVVNRDVATLDNFGEITLVASKALIDKKSGKNAGTWGADAYSPRYPRVEYRLSDKSSTELRERGKSAGLEPFEVTSLEQEIESNGNRFLVGDRRIQKLFDAEGKSGESLSDYVDRFYNGLDITERLFKGYSWDGTRRYAKHTLENVSRMMKAEGRAGAEGNFGMGSVRARLTPIFKNIAQIKKSKNRIVSREEFEAARESLESRFYELARLASTGKYDYAAEDRLGEAMLSYSPKEYLKKEYDIEISEEESQKIKTLASDLSVMPTEYFETKFERPVMLEEFAKAVIPSDASDKTRKILANAGLEVIEYDRNVEGDRLRAVREASEGEGVRFRFIGEQGAEALDKAEEASVRLDNLDVAREMETSGKSAKDVKMATGWERGADGKWRYEVGEDFDFDLNANIDFGKRKPEILAGYKRYRELLHKQNAFYLLSEGENLTPDEETELKHLRGLYRGTQLHNSHKLKDYIEAPELFTAYPELRDVEVRIDELGFGERGKYNSKENKITLSNDLRNKSEYKSTLAHEIQHAIQHIEGFARGGHWQREDYYQLSGEVEARNVARRMGMSAEERRNSLAEETEDVSRKDQLFIMDNLGVSAMVEGSGDKKEKHSVIEPQDLTTIVVSTKNAGAKIITNKDKAKENLNKLSHEFKNKLKTRGFLSSLKESIAGQRLVEQSSYFDFNTPNGEITLRISNHNAQGENFDGGREAISVVVKSERTKNTFEDGENLTEFVYFKERIAKADGKTLSQIAESISDLLDTGVYVDKSGLAVVNPSDEKGFKVNEVSKGRKGGKAINELGVRSEELKGEKVLKGEKEDDVRFRVEEDYAPVWGEGESYAEAEGRLNRKATTLGIEQKRLRRRQSLGKEIDEARLSEVEAELAQVRKDLRYLEDGPMKPELAEGESETDESYVSRMDTWHRAMAEWNSKKWGEDSLLDEALREVGEVDINAISDESVSVDEEKANLSIKEMKRMIKEQIRERRRGIEVSNWQDEMTIHDIKGKTTEEQRKLIPHILEGSYPEPRERKDRRYADYLSSTGKNDVSEAEWSERKDILASNPMAVDNRAITHNQHGARMSDIVEYAVDSDAEILLTGDNLNGLVRFDNGDIYTLDKYGVEYALYLKPEVWQNIMTAEDANILGMFLRGEAELYAPQGLREYVEKKEYGEGNTLDVVNEIRGWYDEAWSQLEAEGMTYHKQALDNYVTHIWDLKKSSPTAVTTMQKFMAATAPKELKDINNYIATNTPYVKERAIGSIRDGEALGLVPKYEDITDIMRDYGHRMNEARENRRLVNFVKTLRVNGMDAIREEGGRSGGLYVPIKNEALRGYEVHRDVKPVLDVIFGDYHTTDNVTLQKLGHLYDTWGGLLKKVNLSMSFFHHGALTETAIAMTNPYYAGKTIFKNILWDAAFKGQLPAFNDMELTKEAVSHFVQLGATSDYATKEVQALTSQFAKWAEGKAGAEELATILDFWNKGMDTALWNYLHDGLKVYGYSKLANEIKAKAQKEGWSEDVLNRALDEAGQLINDTYGGQHWELLGVSPNALKWARRAFLSPDWTLSTLRQALAPFGVGQMYSDDKFWRKWFKDDPVASVRKRYGRAFWVTAALFFGGLMNGLNVYYRMKDEDEENAKAEEIRKTRPEYKSCYELAYPDGMKWWDYTMLANTMGHETHLFGGRYEDGKEQYVRWGKQFRELPELFYGRDGLSFPQPMIDKITGKLNPMINLMSNLSSGYGLNGFQNEYMKNTRGWDREFARLQVLVAAHLPYSIPTDEEKEFKALDLMMPSTKGFSNWKAIDRFKTAIMSGDMDFCDKVYDACVKNGLEADNLLDVAIKQIEVEAKRAMVEGVTDLNDAVSQYDREENPIRKKQLAGYIKKQLSAQDYNEISKEELREKAYLAINGGVSDKNLTIYDKLSNSNDVIEDWRITKGRAGLREYVDGAKAIKEESADPLVYAKYIEENGKYIRQYNQLGKVQSEVNKLKKLLGTEKDDEVMAKIREVRKKAFSAKGQETRNTRLKPYKPKPEKALDEYGKKLDWE